MRRLMVHKLVRVPALRSKYCYIILWVYMLLSSTGLLRHSSRSLGDAQKRPLSAPIQTLGRVETAEALRLETIRLSQVTNI